MGLKVYAVCYIASVIYYQFTAYQLMSTYLFFLKSFSYPGIMMKLTILTAIFVATFLVSDSHSTRKIFTIGLVIDLV